MTDLFPPFAPDPLEPRRRRFKPVPFRVIAPNLVTVLALCLGLTAIRLAYEGHLDTAVICIIVAVGERPVEVVDFPKDPLAANIQRAEVVLAMRVVVGIEALESSDSL